MDFRIEEFFTDLNIFEVYNCVKDNNSILLDSYKEELNDIDKIVFSSDKAVFSTEEKAKNRIIIY